MSSFIIKEYTHQNEALNFLNFLVNEENIKNNKENYIRGLKESKLNIVVL